VKRIAAGYAPGTVHLHYLTTVSFSFSTFLCLTASWTGVDEKSALDARNIPITGSQTRLARCDYIRSVLCIRKVSFPFSTFPVLTDRASDLGQTLKPSVPIQIRIHMFLGLQDPEPDPLVKGMDPDPDPSIIKQK
jgi:hypothetical protein